MHVFSIQPASYNVHLLIIAPPTPTVQNHLTATLSEISLHHCSRPKTSICSKLTLSNPQSELNRCKPKFEKILTLV